MEEPSNPLNSSSHSPWSPLLWVLSGSSYVYRACLSPAGSSGVSINTEEELIPPSRIFSEDYRLRQKYFLCFLRFMQVMSLGSDPETRGKILRHRPKYETVN